MKGVQFPGRAVPLLLFVATFLMTIAAYPQKLIDKDATSETQALYENLFRISKSGFLFGHQDTDAYGVNWVGEPSRSDVKDITGSFPAVHGWDLGEIGGPKNIDEVPFDKMLVWIKAVYDRGGINTISFHFDNPLTGESSWSKGDAVKESLPGGKAHQKFLEHINNLADFLNKCESGGKKIPIIFRPFHEHNGDWFWWGKNIASETDYIKLWRFTVDYLRNEKKLHHLIYAFSPDRSRIDLTKFPVDYLYAYPGDDYVDILGYDNYMDVGRNSADSVTARKNLTEGLVQLSKVAAQKKKVGALTETGLESVTNPKWFTEVLLAPFKANPQIQLAYVMVWRNARANHHYAPYPGHPAEGDFKKFFNDSQTLFETDIQNMYQNGRPLVR